jgi:hypothetical protein
METRTSAVSKASSASMSPDSYADELGHESLLGG